MTGLWLVIAVLIILAVILGIECFLMYSALQLARQALNDAIKEINDVKHFINEKEKYVNDTLAYLKAKFPLFFY